jgi:hypothetical protein
MTEQELRQLVRDAISRHTGHTPLAPLAPRTFGPSDPRTPGPSDPRSVSSALFVLPESDGPCIIEPAVSCNHCGYCKSYGH